MKDIGLRGLALLDAAIAQIEAHPETWHQGAWRCKTGMCVAGWICELAGAQWAVAADAPSSSHLLIAGPDELTGPTGYVDAPMRAQHLLNFDVDDFMDGTGDEDDEHYLFSASNELADIKRIRDEMAKAGLK